MSTRAISKKICGYSIHMKVCPLIFSEKFKMTYWKKKNISVYFSQKQGFFEFEKSNKNFFFQVQFKLQLFCFKDFSVQSHTFELRTIL